jgi:protein-tyrosine phosphatase
LIVALKESEHRPLLHTRFPEWVERVEYWHIDDVDVAEPHVALTELERNVRELVARLHTR